MIWAVSEWGTEDDYTYGICIDIQGNVFVTGYFGSPAITIASSTLVNASGFDVLVVKYDPSGIAQWGRSGEAGFAYASGIDSDASGNVYITGYFQSSITFNSFSFQTLQYDYDMFLVKYDTNGIVQWANRMGGSAIDGAKAIHVDPNGNSYITGWFIDEADFGSGSMVSVNPAAYMEVFVAKFDSNGANL